jgi:2-dehydrotetronate isomerase
MPRFAANLTFLFNEVPFLDRFGEAAQAGFRAVEFAFPYEYQAKDIAERQRAHKLDIVLFNAPAGDWKLGDRGIASLPEREHEFAAGVVTALRMAKALECPRVHVMAGLVPEGIDADDHERRRRTYIRNLRFACNEAAEQGVTITIEPLNRLDNPGYFLTTQAEAHAIREEVRLPNLKVQMDLYHAQITEGNLAHKLRQWIAHIGHVQIANVPGRTEPDVGEINYSYLFRLLDELKYDGYVGCEYRPLQSTRSGLAWLYRLLDRKPATV